jgi:hypothetical protein
MKFQLHVNITSKTGDERDARHDVLFGVLNQTLGLEARLSGGSVLEMRR